MTGGIRKLTLTLKYKDWTGKEYSVPYELLIKVDITREIDYLWILIGLAMTAIVLFVLFRARTLEIGRLVRVRR